MTEEHQGECQCCYGKMGQPHRDADIGDVCTQCFVLLLLTEKMLKRLARKEEEAK